MALNELPHKSIDEIDLNILKLLSENSKLSFAELGEKVGLTAPAVHGRVKKLENNGIIKGYSLVLDYDKIGLPVTAFVRVQTGHHSCAEIGKKVRPFEEVEECHSVAGEDDLMLKVRTATPLALQHLLDKLKLDGLIIRSVSVFVLETVFERSRV
ncbi:Lrp/AsnC family transcriptional regulator [Pseudobdellovibrio exovorus]|uniref:HTH asnC-type domain-containing protein n=1 Tax=Pseudobdellovibrio exovorus JSS TaxID=1184267 RepID=M4VBD5_9BACT|nr:Lrp/AsnC family transcriptional regulator [Pseudobdellovibrio exovorus]AGH96707.1 hypothetical protein A11Q_2491 [Pseudobdellovibrio exovorus JSS]